MEKRYQVFVSSTYVDLKEERNQVIRALMEIDCIPAGMELFPAADEEQYEFIKRIIDVCDYYLLIIGGRYGSLTAQGMSYTEQEYDYALERGLKIIALLREDPDQIPLGKSEHDPHLRARLNSFRERVAKNRIVKTWRLAEQLPGIVAQSIYKAIRMFPAVGWVRGSQDNNRLQKPHNASLARYMQAHEEGYLFEPYRENLVAEVTYDQIAEDIFLVTDKVSYICREVNGKIQDGLLWSAAPEEFIEIKALRIDIKAPVGHPKAGKTKVLHQGEVDAATSKRAGVDVREVIPSEYAVDKLRVTYDTQYIMYAKRINTWQMGTTTRDFALTLTFPKTLRVQLESFVALPEAGNLTLDRPGYFNYRYDEWMLPNDGLAWAFDKIPT